MSPPILFSVNPAPRERSLQTAIPFSIHSQSFTRVEHSKTLEIVTTIYCDRNTSLPIRRNELFQSRHSSPTFRTFSFSPKLSCLHVMGFASHAALRPVSLVNGYSSSSKYRPCVARFARVHVHCVSHFCLSQHSPFAHMSRAHFVHVAIWMFVHVREFLACRATKFHSCQSREF